MNAQTVQRILEPHQAELRTFGVRELLLFGSTAKGQATESSDIDLLVELDRYTLQDFMGLKFALEQWLGKKVDLGTRRSLKPALRQMVEKDLHRVI